MHDSRIALVTGASRGIGAEVARQLAEPDTHVIVNYREKVKRAQTVADDIRALGGRASTLGADISDETAVAAMIAEIGERFGRLDMLVLNASGGLEQGADSGYAMRLNRDAQRRLVELALPLMPTGARIVFVTSHQAHFYPHKAVPKGYAPIALSKRAGETALHGMKHEFDRRGIHFTVVSGDMIDGTIIIRLLQRRDPDAVDARRSFAPLPTVEEFASAIAGAARSPYHPGIVYVGGSDYLVDRSA
ncbi:SDR family oxidoreductase [Mycolicibacterium fluoranthenivorans]|uniref:NAD(P)-dependent dehydrogenase (Short-subunit alcohol dehydrogenase family) n=1 Tax=Mycolicibacterium fluoranthenivorans TaxID=258505 RepID=A0A7X5ZAS0_9MYCO|nr:SDR family oxidoreductase [Mycolicibacterium fluoranthenivorans]MCV7355085.1 SDR family oxidoreductase [Mycolicibacterium fluoranthenivorans]NIH93775.1 NAD(P)-dependent dehydrogenase (short-subunit alcohol dehydrogenase family) [Mycolicibacterium fluoranthenivorans]